MDQRSAYRLHAHNAKLKTMTNQKWIRHILMNAFRIQFIANYQSQQSNPYENHTQKAVDAERKRERGRATERAIKSIKLPCSYHYNCNNF